MVQPQTVSMGALPFITFRLGTVSISIGYDRCSVAIVAAVDVGVVIGIMFDVCLKIKE
jgi:hypothetical protein